LMNLAHLQLSRWILLYKVIRNPATRAAAHSQGFTSQTQKPFIRSACGYRRHRSGNRSRKGYLRDDRKPCRGGIQACRGVFTRAPPSDIISSGGESDPIVRKKAQTEPLNLEEGKHPSRSSWLAVDPRVARRADSICRLDVRGDKTRVPGRWCSRPAYPYLE